MNVPILHYEPKPNPKRWERILLFPLSRIMIAIGFVMWPVLLFGLLSGFIANDIVSGLVFICLALPLSYVTYRLYIHWLESRKATEIPLKGALPELVQGIAYGFTLLCLTILILFLLGRFQITGFGSAAGMFAAFILAVQAGWLEELIIRGIIFRILEEWLGSWLALGISASLFGFLHATNPDSSLWSSVAIALEAGILLGAAFMLTRRLWLAVGLHFAWNFTQGGLFSIAVSGNRQDGLLETTVDGPKWLSGGTFGVEASVITVILCLSLAVWFFYRAKQKGFWVAPSWQR